MKASLIELIDILMYELMHVSTYTTKVLQSCRPMILCRGLFVPDEIAETVISTVHAYAFETEYVHTGLSGVACAELMPSFPTKRCAIGECERAVQRLGNECEAHRQTIGDHVKRRACGRRPGPLRPRIERPDH